MTGDARPTGMVIRSAIHIALLPDKSGFKATGAQGLTLSLFYRYIAPLEQKVESFDPNNKSMNFQH